MVAQLIGAGISCRMAAQNGKNEPRIKQLQKKSRSMKAP
jgi:hypothetical protein